MSGLQALVSSAFGSKACLYKDVLKCASKATPSELRKAYHKRALQYHPDKQQESSSSLVQQATLKFQALSATYQLLSDPSQRSLYDATGRIPDSRDDAGPSHAGGAPTTNTNNTDEWVRFFHTVFQDMIHAGSNFDRKEYCGSKQEEEDVLKYYQLCKGNRSKMMSCIVQSEQEDLERWWKKIIQPAIEKGGLGNYEATTDSSADATTKLKKKKPKKLVRKRKRSVAKAPRQQVEESSSAANELEDTDDDDDEHIKESISRASRVMSRREKMEFRVAKKRKEKAEREIEIAEIMQSKQWTASSFAKSGGGKRGKAKRRNQHGLSETFLSGLQEKFSRGDGDQRGKKKKLKRK